MANCGALRPSFLQAKLPAIRSSPPRYELYLHIEGVREMDWTCRARFFGISARMMRNILVDHARKRRAAKRGSGNVLPLSGCDLEDGGSSDILLVDVALSRSDGFSKWIFRASAVSSAVSPPRKRSSTTCACRGYLAAKRATGSSTSPTQASIVKLARLLLVRQSSDEDLPPLAGTARLHADKIEPRSSISPPQPSHLDPWNGHNFPRLAPSRPPPHAPNRA